jgi:hypothetical protein
VVGTARDMSISFDEGPMWFKWIDQIPDRVIRGKWRIPVGKVGERYVVIFRAP